MSSNLVKTTDYGENQPVGNRAESRILFFFHSSGGAAFGIYKLDYQ
jgi:hypothetical protein